MLAIKDLTGSIHFPRKASPMNAIKEARKLIEREPANPSAQTLSRLVLALESEADFPISDIYLLDYDYFQLALKILEGWRLDRYIAGKARLFDVSLQAEALAAKASAAPSA
jgi:hypothetical protein